MFFLICHCRYLLKDQLKGPSSVEGFVRALKKGCRYIERKFVECCSHLLQLWSLLFGDIYYNFVSVLSDCSYWVVRNFQLRQYTLSLCKKTRIIVAHMWPRLMQLIWLWENVKRTDISHLVFYGLLVVLMKVYWLYVTPMFFWCTHMRLCYSWLLGWRWRRTSYLSRSHTYIENLV